MSLQSWWDIAPLLQSHIFWYKKTAFQLASDRYSSWVMFAVEEGEFAYRIGSEKGTATFGEAVLCPPDTDFERSVIDPVSFHFLTFSWGMEEPAAWNSSPPENPPPFPVKLSFSDTKRLQTTYAHLKDAARQHTETSRRYSSHLLQDLLRQYLYETVRMPALPGDQGFASNDPLMENALTLIRKHAAEPACLRGLASSLGLTPVQFTRRYRAAFGITPSEHVTGLRLQKASSLLTGTSLTLDNIAGQCGYENGFYLSRIFSKKRGISPTEYRKLYRV